MNTWKTADLWLWERLSLLKTAKSRIPLTKQRNLDAFFYIAYKLISFKDDCTNKIWTMTLPIEMLMLKGENIMGFHPQDKELQAINDCWEETQSLNRNEPPN